MPIVRVEPLGTDIPVEPGETVANAAWRLGYGWPTRCWGQAECMLCRARVVAGEPCTAPPTDEEVDALDRRLGLSVARDGVRLACRLYVTGEGVVLEKKGVAPPPG